MYTDRDSIKDCECKSTCEVISQQGSAVAKPTLAPPGKGQVHNLNIWIRNRALCVCMFTMYMYIGLHDRIEN